MQTRLIRYELIEGKYNKVQSEIVTFICITGAMSAIVIDRFGKQKIVRRKSLLDIPNNVLYPEMDVVGRSENVDTESWKRSCYFD